MGGIEKTWTECFYPICAIQEEVKVSRRKPAVFFQIFHGPVNVKTVEYSTSLTLKLSFRLSSLSESISSCVASPSVSHGTTVRIV